MIQRGRQETRGKNERRTRNGQTRETKQRELE